RYGKMARMAYTRLLALCAAATVPVLMAAQSPGRSGNPGNNDQVSDRARQLHMRAIVVDTHADTTQRLVGDKTFDTAQRRSTGNIAMPRTREGGLDAIFFSIWMNGDTTGPAAIKRALDQIDAVREAVRTHPDAMVLATTAADIRQAHAAKKIAALMGVEG